MSTGSLPIRNATGLAPLNVKCTSTDCEHGLHCFTPNRRKRVATPEGKCRTCGADLIDWARFRKLDLADVQFTFASLKYEMWRHHYWHLRLDEKAINYARRKGREGLRDAISKRLSNHLKPDNPFDGRQTPKRENPIFYAQHALACCCRKCMECWYGIPRDKQLDSGQISYLASLVTLYLEEKMPDLPEKGEKVPAVRRKAQ